MVTAELMQIYATSFFGDTRILLKFIYKYCRSLLWCREYEELILSCQGKYQLKEKRYICRYNGSFYSMLQVLNLCPLLHTICTVKIWKEDTKRIPTDQSTQQFLRSYVMCYLFRNCSQVKFHCP